MFFFIHFVVASSSLVTYQSDIKKQYLFSTFSNRLKIISYIKPKLTEAVNLDLPNPIPESSFTEIEEITGKNILEIANQLIIAMKNTLDSAVTMFFTNITPLNDQNDIEQFYKKFIDDYVGIKMFFTLFDYPENLYQELYQCFKEEFDDFSISEEDVKNKLAGYSHALIVFNNELYEKLKQVLNNSELVEVFHEQILK